jgi:hypothetical protein
VNKTAVLTLEEKEVVDSSLGNKRRKRCKKIASDACKIFICLGRGAFQPNNLPLVFVKGN